MASVGLQGASSLLGWFVDEALTVGLDFAEGQAATPARPLPRNARMDLDLAPVHGWAPGASGLLGRCALVHMDDCLVHSLMLEQLILDVAEML